MIPYILGVLFWASYANQAEGIVQTKSLVVIGGTRLLLGRFFSPAEVWCPTLTVPSPVDVHRRSLVSHLSSGRR